MQARSVLQRTVQGAFRAKEEFHKSGMAFGRKWPLWLKVDIFSILIGP